LKTYLAYIDIVCLIIAFIINVVYHCSPFLAVMACSGSQGCYGDGGVVGCGIVVGRNEKYCIMHWATSVRLVVSWVCWIYLEQVCRRCHIRKSAHYLKRLIGTWGDLICLKKQIKSHQVIRKALLMPSFSSFSAAWKSEKVLFNLSSLPFLYFLYFLGIKKVFRAI
jgi:hypothetical protein